MRATRAALIAIGAPLMAYAAWLMVRGQTVSQLVQVVEWAAASVVIHDGVIAGVAVAIGWLGHRLLPPAVAGPAALAGLLAGTLAVGAFAVVGRSHGGGPNTTLLDRDYPLGLLFVMLGVIGSVVLTAALRRISTVGRARRSRGWRG